MERKVRYTIDIEIEDELICDEFCSWLDDKNYCALFEKDLNCNIKNDKPKILRCQECKDNEVKN